ncbi:PH domain-containing protein [Cytobacillus oceanisediminis]|uniref:PH domain-containing protein n=2 Tax=Niallia TaxID=2837506 RepID=A0A941JJF8_NIACI|nr:MULTISPECIES: PH domain-containing protein [Bacillaceae]EOR26140.1 membrane-flanked domain-containing protein [Niallia nealsonii AAU1]MBQ6446710.1 PH domain-containing protein [Bacillus sp. (in: firmicutes)]MDU1844650.1 PH domain-containing protein [Niallia nealsonii]MBZ9534821.1 PH domain-containing protein [Cytobacillus oceanisediminis]MCB5238177.1 PH domain-containing protein [Niallia circulans]
MVTIPQNRLSKKGITVWRLTGLISSLIMMVIGGALITLAILFDWHILVSIGTIIYLLFHVALTIGILPPLKWKRWRYEVRGDEIEIQQGVIVIKRTLIPMIRVQHVDMKQGPLLKKYELATVSISTAATIHEIPVLEVEEAEEIRHYISSKTKVAEEDV